jgi:D-alanyl-lipoteichoic acid acyltransferase DltB (MBOAT superfamily)
MLFNSNDFLIFFALLLVAYFVAQGSLFLRNLVVVVGGYVFYSWWDYRFCGLLLFTSLLDFTVGWLIGSAATERRKRGLLATSIVLNLSVLGFFKYFNFFRESFEVLLDQLGISAHWAGWEVLLPVGISFYTFQSMSYVIDVYRREIPASHDLLGFLGYVSFFPHLVAGPIQRGTTLLPQFGRTLAITASDLELGVWLTVWGMFKKVVIADNLSPLVNLAYQHPDPSGPIIFFGTVAFAIQIYCDFSGYTDIATGISRLIGFKLTLNFNLPYCATSLREFWRRWHISLSTWLRDYLYIPLGGNRKAGARVYLNLGITMLLGGLWHGASLTFVLWGAWHGLGLIANRWWDEHRPFGRALPAWLGWLVTQAFVLYGWLLFRALSLDQVLQFTSALANFSVPHWWRPFLGNFLVLTAPLLAVQVWQWRSGDLNVALRLPRWCKAVLQALLLADIIAFWQPDPSPFIYFQF